MWKILDRNTLNYFKMKKTATILFFIFGIITLSYGQMTIEEQVSDTACICLTKLDTAQIKANAIKKLRLELQSIL